MRVGAIKVYVSVWSLLMTSLAAIWCASRASQHRRARNSSVRHGRKGPGQRHQPRGCSVFFVSMHAHVRVAARCCPQQGGPRTSNAGNTCSCARHAGCGCCWTPVPTRATSARRGCAAHLAQNGRDGVIRPVAVDCWRAAGWVRGFRGCTGSSLRTRSPHAAGTGAEPGARAQPRLRVRRASAPQIFF